MTGSDIVRQPLVAGIGCTSIATGEEIVELVRLALAQVSGELIALATAQRRAGHPAMHHAAATLCLPLRIIDLPGPEVAEPIAASAGPLILGKVKSDRVTCALASVPAGFDPLSWGQPSAMATMASSTVATSVAGP